MTINRVIIAGLAGKDARSSSTQNGKTVTRLSIATTKRYKDREEIWHEKTQWHACVAYGPAAQHAAEVHSGDRIFIEGELIYRDYDRTIETETGPVKVQWPITEVVIESISILERKERKGAA